MEKQQMMLEELQQMNRTLRKHHRHPKPYGPCHPGAFFALIKIEECCEENPEAPGAGVGELAEVLEVSVPAVSKMLRTLEERALVERLTDPKNRRNVYVRLTGQGQQILAEAAEHERARIQQVVQVLGEEDMEHLLRIMKKLIEYERGNREVDRC